MKFFTILNDIKQEFKQEWEFPGQEKLASILLSLFMRKNKLALWGVEHSQYSEDCGMYPFHIDELSRSTSQNMCDFLYNNRKRNKWQIVFIGTHLECCNAHDVMRKEYERRQQDKILYGINIR